MGWPHFAPAGGQIVNHARYSWFAAAWVLAGAVGVATDAVAGPGGSVVVTPIPERVPIGSPFFEPNDYRITPSGHHAIGIALDPLWIDPGGCPRRITFRVGVRPGSNTFYEESFAATRRDVLRGLVESMGAGAATVVVSVEAGQADEVTVEYDFARDHEKPRLQTTSVPPKGTKVQPGDQIRVTMIAADDANPWQSGIKTVELRVEGAAQGLDVENFNPPGSCLTPPAQRRLEATYTVPANPPPVVRLTALTEDHVGLTDTDVGEFPTGDWYGTVSVHNPSDGPHQTRIDAEFALTHDGRGGLTGSMVGNQVHIASSDAGCSRRTNRPNRFRFAMAGSYSEGRSPGVTLRNVQETKLAVGVLCDGTPPQEYETSITAYMFTGIIPLLGQNSPMGEGELLPDGSRRYRLDTGTARFEVMLHRARN
jgi:hypothetical protein